jgi:hypothetical protein
MQPPIPTPILRLVHVSNLETLLARGAVHAPSSCPSDGLAYQSIHEPEVLRKRQARRIDCGPRGTIRDYVSFYFGPLSPMLLRLTLGQVRGHQEGQSPRVHLVTCAQAIARRRLGFVFSDGHGLAVATRWFDDLDSLDRVDWEIVAARYWMNTPEDPDRQRRKQAEFLVHRALPWALVEEIVVLDGAMVQRVEGTLEGFPGCHRPRVRVRAGWYYR